MKPLSRLQALEKQNKDLRTRLYNSQGKSELAMAAMYDELKSNREQLSTKNGVVTMLQAEIGVLTRKLDAAHDMRAEIIQAKVDAAVELAVATAKAPLLNELAKVHLEIARLKAIINKDASNSSKPSSKSGFRKIPNCREKSGKPRGGQIGHPPDTAWVYRKTWTSLWQTVWYSPKTVDRP